MSTDNFSINVTKEDMYDQLDKLVVQHPNKQAILDTLIGHLRERDKGLIQLWKSIHGLDILPDYKVGDVFYVKIDMLWSWSFDTILTKASDLIYQDRLKVAISEINPYNDDPYTIKYIALDKAGKEKICQQNIMNSYLEVYEDIPDEFPF